jgi:hypothetical protein
VDLVKQLELAFGAPLCLVIFLAGVGLLAGADTMIVFKAVVIGLPVTAYLCFAIFTTIWAIRVGEIGVKQGMTFQAKFYFYHGVAVILTIVLSASGSFIILFALLIGRLLSAI